MLILLDCRPMQLAGPESEKNRLILSALATLSVDQGLEWLFLFDDRHQGKLPDLPGGRLLTLRAFRGTLGWRLWYDWKLPRLVKKYKPDLVMLTGGVAVRKIPVPQCLWMPVHADGKQGFKLPVYISRLDNSLRDADSIICFSEKDRTWLAHRGPITADRIFVARPGVSSGVAPLPAAEKERLKQQYAQGKEYFFTEATRAGEEQVVQLLKAYSLFKKRQLSNLRLVIAGVLTAGLRSLLTSYKYRDDVHWIATDAGVDEPMAASYAALFPFGDGSLGGSLLNAWRAGVPTLVAGTGTLHELAKDAALPGGVQDPPALAHQLMSVYKDESLRNNLIQKGFNRLTAFDPPSLPAILRNIIRKS